MKKLLLAFMAITLFACSGDDTVTPEPDNGNPENPENPQPVQECTNIYTGDVWLKGQAEVDAFAANNYCKINGLLYVGAFDGDPSSDITSISGLSGLVSINRWVIITNNANLLSLNGLHNIKGLENLTITVNSALTNLEGCPDVLEGGNVIFSGNGISLQGLELKNYMFLRLAGDIDLGYFLQYNNVKILSELSILQNKATTLAGLENLKKIGELKLHHNPNLISLRGLENVTKLEYIGIGSNPELVSLEHLNGITAIENIPEITSIFVTPGFEIRGNTKLQSLNGLENIVSYRGSMLSIAGNDVLTDFCALTPLLQNDSDKLWDVFNNKYNPTKQNIINGNCSQP